MRERCSSFAGVIGLAINHKRPEARAHSASVAADCLSSRPLHDDPARAVRGEDEGRAFARSLRDDDDESG
jgi:hypothetical protein